MDKKLNVMIGQDGNIHDATSRAFIHKFMHMSSHN